MAYDSRNIPLQDVQKDYYAGRYYLFDGIAGAVLFEIVQLEGRPHFHIYLAGGELAELEQFWNELTREGFQKLVG
jgi:hypothetical protein